MSIFKDSFHPSIKDQLSTRQAAMTTRTPQNLQYLNSRNAWIRMSSSVNVYKGPASASMEDLQNEANYDNSLANKYVLQGGILNSGNFRAGLGDFSNAYSNVGSDGTSYRLGIRPMPGITGVDIKNKGAYGSLRQATITFQCWDIKQLEDLELLYMRPGYTVLLEWGWSPYLKNGTVGNNYNDTNLITTVDYTDIINTDWTKENLFKRQYARATDGHYIDENGNKVDIIGYQGNADSMFGFIKNYSWKARMDGGYDCTTEIISMGEVIESLKVNYSPADSNAASNGLLSSNVGQTIDDKDQLKKEYTKNILAGLFYELWEIGKKAGAEYTFGQLEANETGTSLILTDTKYKSTYDLFRVTININGGEKAARGTGEIGKSDEQIYITLETLCSILNNYVLLRDKKSSDQTKKSRPFAPLSVKESEYVTTDVSSSGYLLSLAYPLQVSIDPTVCLIKNNLWAKGINIKLAAPTTIDTKTGDSVVTFSHNLTNVDEFVETIIRNTAPVDNIDDKDGKPALAKYIKDYIQGPENSRYGEDQIKENLKEVTRVFNKKYSTYKIGLPTLSASFKLSFDANSNAGKRVGKTLSETLPATNTFLDLLDDRSTAHLDRTTINDILGGEDNAKKIADGDPEQEAKDKIEEENEKLQDAAEKGAEGFKFLSNLSMPYFLDDDYNTELGIIGHIYVNVNMLYNLCVSDDLASQDKKEKQEIALYDFVKNVLKKISASTGEMNNLDIFVNPETNIAQIIDINYVDRKSQTEAYDNAFQLEVHNLNSTVRSYSLESKIFQEQSSIVAIGAQVGGGALGVDTTTLVAFNKSIRDRIIPIKDAPTSSPTDEDPNLKLEKLTKSLSLLYTYAGDLKQKWYGADGSFDVDKTGQYAGALKDIITFFKTLGKSKSKNRAILPTVLNVDLDGIGGMIIGNLFRINQDILPKGYKTGDDGGIGPKLGYILTNIGHSIKDNDWVTKLEAQTIILDKPQGMDIPFGALTITDESTGESSVTVATNASGTAASPAVEAEGKGNWNTLNNTLRSIANNLGSWKETGANPNIINAYKEVAGVTYRNDTTAWCAAFVGYVLKTSGLSYLKTLSSLAYANYGTAVPLNDPTQWRKWDIIVWKNITKAQKGHVSFLTGVTKSGLTVIEPTSAFGGNQGNRVKVSKYPFDKTFKVLAVRRGWTPPAEQLPAASGDLDKRTR
jgi:uncharacterized protein (TIGR02594 family)